MRLFRRSLKGILDQAFSSAEPAAAVYLPPSDNREGGLSMPDLHVGLLSRSMHIAVESIEILPSLGPQNADLCHPSSS